MKPTRKRHGQAGYISYVMVVSTGTLLMLATFFVYRTAMNSREVQAKVQMRVDYTEKEDAILRSIVAITPNRAMQAMMDGSGVAGGERDSLRWSDIFTDALNLANARTSAGADLLQSVGGGERLYRSNVGDSEITDISQVFSPISEVNTNEESMFCSHGINRDLGDGFPPPLQSSVTTPVLDATFPIISTDKRYGTLAEGQVGLSPTTYSDFNLIPYPQINFGYTRPGEPFVAKRNWWAFEMDLAAADRVATKLMAPRRKFVFSIYEVPSQLAISSSSFMALGRHGSGDAWGNVTIEGHVFTGKALVEGDLSLDSLASRRSMELSTQSTIGGESFLANPFAPGTRENYQITQGEFYPVSLASESGRVAFIPINRGAAFFDRHHEDNGPEANTISPTGWNNYTSGALQCAMSLDITKVDENTNAPTEFRFRAKPNIEFLQPVVTGIAGPLPPGYNNSTAENSIVDFGDQVVDVAFGSGGRYFFQPGVTGEVVFNNARFTDPNPGNAEGAETGYWRPAAPFKVTPLPSGERICVEILPERFPAFLTQIGASGPADNHSIVVNVDYTNSGLANPNFNPIVNEEYVEMLPGDIPNYGVILRECTNLTVFPRGFSLVSNLRTYFGDDFNTTPTTPPADYAAVGAYYPPVSIFVPEKRYGVDENPYAISLEGQAGSLRGEDTEDPSRPLDATSVTGDNIGTGQMQVNLKPIEHPAALPPVFMMNWLVTIEELRGEHMPAAP